MDKTSRDSSPRINPGASSLGLVTKLTRYHAKDREDIRILCDTGEVAEETLRNRFELAHAWSDQEDRKFIDASANLESVVGYLKGERESL